jgi:hypothetical protein
MLIVPIAADADTIRPDTATPSSLENENSPLFTGGGGERVRVADVPHPTLVSVSFSIVNAACRRYRA